MLVSYVGGGITECQVNLGWILIKASCHFSQQNNKKPQMVVFQPTLTVFIVAIQKVFYFRRNVVVSSLF